MDKTLAKGLRLLEALIESPEPKGVADLARELEWSKSNVHRLLQTLCELGYVHGDKGRYWAGLRVWSLGTQVIGRMDIKSLAAPTLVKLAASSQESVHLSIYDRGEVIYIDKIDSSQPIRAYSRVGGRAPAWCVATGKALLAHQSDEEIAAVAARLESFTPNTLASSDSLLAALAEVRATGCAVNRGEWRAQVSGVGAPIRDATGKVVAALGISGPAERFTEPALATFIPMVRASAEAVSQALGAPIDTPLHKGTAA